MTTLTHSPRSLLGSACYDRATIARGEKPRPSSLPWRTVLSTEGRCGWVKRALDLAGALVGLVLFSPVLLAIALLIRLDSPGPALFCQIRRGHRGRLFRMLKFRTMVADAALRLRDLEPCTESAGGGLFKVGHDPRVAPLWRVLPGGWLTE